MLSEFYENGQHAALEKVGASVAALAVVHDNKLLMGKRRDSNKFTQPGGHLEKGESPIEAAKRELFEETGLDLPSRYFKPMSTERVSKGKSNFNVHSFMVNLVGKRPATTVRHDPDNEVLSWKWVSPGKATEVLKNLHVPIDKNVIFKDILKRGLH